MLKWKLKKNPIELVSFSYLKDYLENLGIKRTESFIVRPNKEDEEDYNRLENINEACEILYKGFKENKKFFLQVDSDTDGYTSSAIFYSFFKRLFPEVEISWRLHEQKEHGVILDTIPIESEYIIIPDAGSNQFDQQEQLSREGRTTVIIDHHNVGMDYPRFDNVTIVNNQSSPRFKNKYLSGAGVVYKLIQAFNEKYKDEFPMIYEDYTDLAAVGIVADMMDTRELDNNYIIYKGLRNIKNPMLMALLEKQRFSIERGGGKIEAPTKINIAFYIAPIINGVIRFGTTEEKEKLFEGFCDYERDEVITTQYAGQPRKEDYYDYIARTSSNVRGRQNREKEKCMIFLKDRIETQKLYENQLIIVKVSKEDEVKIPHTITGLVAMELLKEYKKPVLVLRPKSDGNGGTTYAGSGRGKANGDFDSLFGMLRESGLCDFVEGHDMAHGVGIPKDNLPKVIDFANEYLKEVEFDVTEMEVDYVFRNGDINTEMIREFGQVPQLYGNGIPQPKFAFDVRVSAESFQFLKGNHLKFTIGEIEVIKFFAKDVIKEIQENKTFMYDVRLVGRAQINEFLGKQTPQIIVDEMEISPVHLESLF